MKVLVVDDDKLARKGLISIMDWKKYGFEVVGDVQNGRKALEFLKDNEVDIVFTDIDMPEIDGIELMKMCKEVQSGDRTHVEAKAAAFYFKSLYGLGFSRGNDHIINAALNYGYAIVRGLIARSIVCYGLEPSIGVFHHSELNNFNLADDMIEPFRPLVDLYVAQNYDIAEIDSDLTPERKRGIFGIINYDMDMKGEKRIISNCIDMLVASYSGALQGKRSDLELPELMQLQVHSYE
jgi:CRISPR-associated protein Cas1